MTRSASSGETNWDMWRLFHTPVVRLRDPGLKAIAADVETYLLELSNRTGSESRSNVGGHHSPNMVGKGALSIPHLRQITRVLHRELVTLDPDQADEPLLQRFECWGNVMRKGHLHLPHQHRAQWAAIYYARASRDDGAALHLHDPRSPIMEVFELTRAKPDHVLRPETGDLIIFPAWLIHSVTALEAELRVSLAMNVYPTASVTPTVRSLS